MGLILHISNKVYILRQRLSLSLHRKTHFSFKITVARSPKICKKAQEHKMAEKLNHFEIFDKKNTRVLNPVIF